MQLTKKKESSIKILFIGDLKSAFNFGAIATSDVLIGMLKTQLGPEHELRIIDHRNCISEVPECGLGEWEAPSLTLQRKLRMFATRILFGSIALSQHFSFFYRFNLHKLHSRLLKCGSHIPSLYGQYKTELNKIKNNGMLPYERKLLEWADIVIINGEGTIVHGTDAWGRYKEGARYTLFMAYLAKAFNKKTALINHTVDPDNPDAIEIIQHIYPTLDYVSVREPFSIDKLESMEVKCPVEYNPDALFAYNMPQAWQPPEHLRKVIDFSKPYICLGDSSGIKSTASTVKWCVYEVFSALHEKLQCICPQVILIDGFAGNHIEINAVAKRKKIPTLNLYNCDYHDLIGVLGNAQCFISGRWHASIMGALTGTPFILWGSDSHKTKALTALYDYPFSFYDVHTLPLHLDDLCRDVEFAYANAPSLRKKNIKKNQELRDQAINSISFLKEWLKPHDTE